MLYEVITRIICEGIVMYQRIMAAIDSNFASSPVLEAAIQTAGKFGARLVV